MSVHPEVKTSTTTTTVRQVRFQLGREDIISMLRAYYKLNGVIEVFFRVPSGADWSGIDIDIDHENPVTVVVTERTEETK